jgi:hypothetical protein
MTNLIDGERYWLGVCYGIYRADGDYFLLGNTWVARSQTIFA